MGRRAQDDRCGQRIRRTGRRARAGQPGPAVHVSDRLGGREAMGRNSRRRRRPPAPTDVHRRRPPGRHGQRPALQPPIRAHVLGAADPTGRDSMGGRMRHGVRRGPHRPAHVHTPPGTRGRASGMCQMASACPMLRLPGQARTVAHARRRLPHRLPVLRPRPAWTVRQAGGAVRASPVCSSANGTRTTPTGRQGSATGSGPAFTSYGTRTGRCRPSAYTKDGRSLGDAWVGRTERSPTLNEFYRMLDPAGGACPVF